MTSIELVTSENQLPNNQLKALWHAKKGNWDRAHEIAQSNEGEYDYDRIHAYLHRVEGDLFNAKWWYRQIGVAFPEISLDEEWQQLVEYYS